MVTSDFYLICFFVGTLWAATSLFMGGLHVAHIGKFHFGKAHFGKGHAKVHSKWGSMLSPAAMAVFLAWFGGLGYILTRHSGLMLAVNLAISAAFGLCGMYLVAAFVRMLQKHERPMDPLDYEMPGVFGQVSCPIRSGGVGEVLYVREGSRRCVPARSEDGTEIGKGQEVVVVRYEGGTAFVRTWEAMTRETNFIAEKENRL